MFINTHHARRNLWIRTIAGITGDVAIGVATSTACIWIIQSASLGLFLSFLLWILTLLLSLAISQYVVRPALRFALSDSKLDRGIDALCIRWRSSLAMSAPISVRRCGSRCARAWGSWLQPA